MSIVTFWNGTSEQTGTTSSSIALATQMAIEHNMKILLVSTGLNDTVMRDSFWTEKKKSTFGLFGTKDRSTVDTSGVEGLDRAARSNKVTPEMITDYTKTVLTGRLEILLGVEGTEGQYSLIKERYSQIISLANKFYDMVIVDLDKNIGKQAEIDILKVSNIIVPVVSQRAKEIQKIQREINSKNILREENTVITIGKYIEDTKYNAKNITRNILKKKDIVNTIPYNSLFFEASQEGKIVDLFINFMRLKDKDENYHFIEEIKKLQEMIKIKTKMAQMIK